MPREIKFRAWDKRINKFTNQYIIDHNGIPKEYIHYDGYNDASEYITLTQYTGLKDKNGKEIYEGDVLSYGHPDIYDVEVFYNEEKSAFFVRWFDEGRYEEEPINLYYYYTKYFISGNIYENPELLEKIK